MIVEKQVFTLDTYRTAGGAEIADVRIGWESYGRLNADRSNAILITHFFSGTSHAAGRYRPDEALPGYWDAIIGPGKAIDTERWFVLSSDTLVNLNARSPHVVTTGPASIDRRTGRRWGMTFPVVTIRDFVAVQKALVESLGIRRLAAVAGPSMGALQAYEWAATYPDMVERIVPVIGAAGGDPFLIAWLDLWAQPIRLDPAWKGGDYPAESPPLDGLVAALKLVSLHANGSDWARDSFGRRPAAAGRDPAGAFENRFLVQARLETDSAARAATAEANHLLYLAKANQLAATDPSRIQAPTLVVSSPTDLVFPPDWIDRTADAIAAAGTAVRRAFLNGPNGHLNGLTCIDQASRAIADFLADPPAG